MRAVEPVPSERLGVPKGTVKKKTVQSTQAEIGLSFSIHSSPTLSSTEFCLTVGGGAPSCKGQAAPACMFSAVCFKFTPAYKQHGMLDSRATAEKLSESHWPKMWSMPRVSV